MALNGTNRGFRRPTCMRQVAHWALLAFLLSSVGAMAAPARSSHFPPVQQSSKRATSRPYTGDLSIFDSPGREQRLQIGRVMEVLGITPGKSVADIGAGSGWFTVRAARKVGDQGKVFAVDINPEAVSYIEDRAHREKLANVQAILSRPDNPLLPPDSVDAALFLKAYHEVADPVVLLEKLRPALRAGAKVGIIDRTGNGGNHGVGRDVVIREAGEAGYQLANSYDFVKGDGMDYFLVFTLKH